MKREIKYITDCRESAIKRTLFCEFDNPEEMDRTKYKVNGKWRKYYSCPVHGGLLIQRKTTCVECGIEIYINKQGTADLRCQPCAERVKILKKKEASTKYFKSNKKTKTVIKRIKSRAPCRVMSVTEAIQKGVNCIPLNRLFLVYSKIDRLLGF